VNDLLFLAPWILVPAVLLAFVPRGFRLTVLALASLFGLGIGLVVSLGGPDSPRLVYPLFGLAVAVGALLAEGAALLVRLARRRRPNG